MGKKCTWHKYLAFAPLLKKKNEKKRENFLFLSSRIYLYFQDTGLFQKFLKALKKTLYFGHALNHTRLNTFQILSRRWSKCTTHSYTWDRNLLGKAKQFFVSLHPIFYNLQCLQLSRLLHTDLVLIVLTLILEFHFPPLRKHIHLLNVKRWY